MPPYSQTTRFNIVLACAIAARTSEPARIYLYQSLKFPPSLWESAIILRFRPARRPARRPVAAGPVHRDPAAVGVEAGIDEGPGRGAGHRPGGKAFGELVRGTHWGCAWKRPNHAALPITWPSMAFSRASRVVLAGRSILVSRA